MNVLKFYCPGILLIFLSTSFKPENNFAPVAVIELFTSQGCSSCPPADQLLAQTIADASKGGKKIFALEFHVDYWNRLGWTDPFSDQKYSQRQQDYDTHLNTSVYTPQMIVNGKTAFVGSDQSALNDALSSAFNENAATSFKNLSASLQPDQSLKIHYELDGNYDKSNVCFALLSLKEITSVGRGENGGRTLTNENIVRQFSMQNAAASGDATLAAASLSAEKNMALVAFVQQTGDLKITGATEIAVSR